MAAFAVFLALLGIGVHAAAVSFFRQPANQTAVVGDEMVTMQCYVENYKSETAFSIQWEKDEFVYESFDTKPRYSIDKSSGNRGERNLIITDIQVKDDGMYSCQFSGQKEKLKSVAARLNVLAPPKKTQMTPGQESGTIIVEKGESIRVICQAALSKPASVISWRVSGRAMEGTSSTKTGDSKLTSTTSSIVIDSIMTSSGSLIECVITHPANQNPIIINAILNVVYPPGMPTISGDLKQTYSEGEFINLLCTSVGGNPLADLSWSIGGRIISSDVKRLGNTTTSELKFKLKAEDHREKLTCSASNSALERPLSIGVDLDVTFVPSNVSLTQFPPEVREDQTASLTCSSSPSNPAAELVWLLNGSSIPTDDGRFNISKTISGDSSLQTVLTLSTVKREDRFDVFTCYVTVPLINYKKKVSTHFNLLFPPSSLDLVVQSLSSMQFTGSNPDGVEGEQVLMKCSVKGGNPTPVLEWFRNEIQLSKSDRFDINSQSDCVAGETCSTLIVTVTPDDDGALFKCKAAHSALNDPMEKSHSMQVFFAPTSLTVTRNPVPAVSGHSMTLECLTSPCKPKAKFGWFIGNVELTDHHDDFFIPPGGRKLVSRSTLQFIPKATDNKANITCRASNILNKVVEETIAIHVQHAPYFERRTNCFNATEGEDDFVIYVPVHANPPVFNYSWSRLLPVKGQQKALVSQSLLNAKRGDFQKYPIHQNKKAYWSYMEGTLMIKRVNRSDKGLYILEAENALGKSKMELYLNVFYPPDITRLEGPSSVNENKSASLVCRVSSHPLKKLTIKWIKKNPNPKRHSLVAVTSEGESVLTLNDVTSFDRGAYECVASNGIGSPVKKEIQLRVKFPATIDSKKTPKKVAKPDRKTGSVTISCYSVGYPRPTFSWRSQNKSDGSYRFDTNRDSVDLDAYYSNLTVGVDGSSNDVIEYTCEVSNFLGSDSTKVLLVPSGPPDPPKDFTADNVTSSSVLLSWKPGFDGGEKQDFVVQYKLLTNKRPTKTSFAWRNITLSPGTITYRLLNLKPSDTYQFRISARNKHGPSAFSSELVIATESDNQFVKSSSEGESMPSYLLAILCVCGFTSLVMVIGLFMFCKKKFDRRRSKSSETNSIPTTDSNLTQDLHEKRADKSNGSDQASNISITPAETLSGRSDFSACGMTNASRRLEMSPSPDSTYSSLVPDVRSRTENSYVDHDNLIVRRSSVTEVAEREIESSFSRPANSPFGLRSQSTQPNLSYMDFVRRATLPDTEAEDGGCKMWMKERQNGRCDPSDAYKTHRLYHTLSSTTSRPPTRPLVRNSSSQDLEPNTVLIPVRSPFTATDVNYLHNTVNVTSAMVGNSPGVCIDAWKTLDSGESERYSADHMYKRSENPYLAIMNQQRPSSLSVRPIEEQFTNSRSWAPSPFASTSHGVECQSVDVDARLSTYLHANGFRSSIASSSAQPLLPPTKRCMTPVCETKQGRFSHQAKHAGDVSNERTAFLEVDQPGTLFV